MLTQLSIWKAGMRAIGIALLLLTGCGVANHHPPVGLMDAPAIEFRNAEGVGRWCPQGNRPLDAAEFRACRERLLADGYREVGPWCGGTTPTGGEVAAAAALGGISGVMTTQDRAAHQRACEQRQATQ